MNKIRNVVLLALFVLATPLHSQEQESKNALSPSEQFELISSWEGRWQVAETPALEIVFEQTARGSVMVERWETASGLHSMTVYHLDGDVLVATHYCPQGNQPRLESRATVDGQIRFTFRDVTDLDAGESHTHDLWFVPGDDGTIRRAEVYRGESGLQEPGQYTLSRMPSED